MILQFDEDQVMGETCNAPSLSVKICVGQYIKNNIEKREKDDASGRENESHLWGVTERLQSTAGLQ